MRLSLSKLDNVERCLFILASFAFNILCGRDGGQNRSRSSRDSHDKNLDWLHAQLIWQNRNIHSARKLNMQEFKCDFTGECFSVLVVEPLCSHGYLVPPSRRSGYLKVSVRVYTLCSDDSLSFTLAWFWASSNGKEQNEITRCSALWTCRVPLYALTPSALMERWLNVILYADGNFSSQNPTVLMSLRSVNQKGGTNASKLATEVSQGGRLEKLGHKDQPEGNVEAVTNQTEKTGIDASESKVLRNSSLMSQILFNLHTVDAAAHRNSSQKLRWQQERRGFQKVQYLNLNNTKKFWQSAARHRMGANILKNNRNKSISILEEILQHSSTHRKNISFQNIISVFKGKLVRKYDNMQAINDNSRINISIVHGNYARNISEVSAKETVFQKVTRGNIADPISASQGRDHLSSGDPQASPHRLKILLTPQRTQGSVHTRRKRSIRQVDGEEAADIAILMGSESKEDRSKIAAMIASDFDSREGLSDPVVARQLGGSKLLTAGMGSQLRPFKRLGHLITALEDEQAKVASNLPPGADDDEDLLVEPGSEAHLANLRHQIKNKKRQILHTKSTLNRANLRVVAANMQHLGVVSDELIVTKNNLKNKLANLQSSMERLRETYSDLIQGREASKTQSRKFNGVVMLDPMWSLWSAWSSCSKDCSNGGYSVRRRYCDTMPSVPCPGSDFAMKPCNSVTCEGQWLSWEEWGPCSATCGKGVRARSRVCLAGKSSSIVTCAGSPTSMIPCNQIPCSTYDDAGNVLVSPAEYAAPPPPVPPAYVTVWRKNKKTSPAAAKARQPSAAKNYRRRKPSVTKGIRGRPAKVAKSRRQRALLIPAEVAKENHIAKRSVATYQAAFNNAPLVVPKKFRDHRPPIFHPFLWGVWGPWSGCSQACGEGVRERARRCVDYRDKSATSAPAARCRPGEASQTVPCVGQLCQAALAPEAVAAAAVAAASANDIDDDDPISDDEEEDVAIEAAEAAAQAYPANAAILAAAAPVAVGGAGVAAAAAADSAMVEAAPAPGLEADKLEEEEEEEAQLTGETIAFIVLLIIVLLLLIVAFCIWFSSRYQEAKMHQELSESLPFYNLQTDRYDDDYDHGGDTYEGRAMGVIKPIVRHGDEIDRHRDETVSPAELRRGNSRHDGHGEAGSYHTFKPDSPKKKRLKAQSEASSGTKGGGGGGSGGGLWGALSNWTGGKSKHGESKVGYAIHQTEFPAEVMLQFTKHGIETGWPLCSKSDISGAGDVTLSMSDSSVGMPLDDERAFLDDATKRLKLENLEARLNKHGGRRRSGRERDSNLKGKHKRSRMVPVDEGDSSDSKAGGQGSSILRKSNSLPKLVGYPHEDGQQRFLYQSGTEESGLAERGAPTVRPSLSDTLLHTEKHGRGYKYRVRRRFPQRLQRENRQARKAAGRAFSSFSLEPTSWQNQGRSKDLDWPVRPSEGFHHISTQRPQELSPVHSPSNMSMSVLGEKHADSGSDRQTGPEENRGESMSTTDKTGRDTILALNAELKPHRDLNMRRTRRRRGEEKLRPLGHSFEDSTPVSFPSKQSSGYSPVASHSSSTWLTSLLSETDLKLGAIDREMDSVLNQVYQPSIYADSSIQSFELNDPELTQGDINATEASSSTTTVDERNRGTSFRKPSSPWDSESTTGVSNVTLAGVDQFRGQTHFRKPILKSYNAEKYEKASDSISSTEKEEKSHSSSSSRSEASHLTQGNKSEQKRSLHKSRTPSSFIEETMNSSGLDQTESEESSKSTESSSSKTHRSESDTKENFCQPTDLCTEEKKKAFKSTQTTDTSSSTDDTSEPKTSQSVLQEQPSDSEHRKRSESTAKSERVASNRYMSKTSSEGIDKTESKILLQESDDHQHLSDTSDADREPDKSSYSREKSFPKKHPNKSGLEETIHSRDRKQKADSDSGAKSRDGTPSEEETNQLLAFDTSQEKTHETVVSERYSDEQGSSKINQSSSIQRSSASGLDKEVVQKVDLDASNKENDNDEFAIVHSAQLDPVFHSDETDQREEVASDEAGLSDLKASQSDCQKPDMSNSGSASHLQTQGYLSEEVTAQRDRATENSSDPWDALASESKNTISYEDKKSQILKMFNQGNVTFPPCPYPTQKDLPEQLLPYSMSAQVLGPIPAQSRFVSTQPESQMYSGTDNSDTTSYWGHGFHPSKSQSSWILSDPTAKRSTTSQYPRTSDSHQGYDSTLTSLQVVTSGSNTFYGNRTHNLSSVPNLDCHGGTCVPESKGIPFKPSAMLFSDTSSSLNTKGKSLGKDFDIKDKEVFNPNLYQVLEKEGTKLEMVSSPQISQGPPTEKRAVVVPDGHLLFTSCVPSGKSEESSSYPAGQRVCGHQAGSFSQSSTALIHDGEMSALKKAPIHRSQDAEKSSRTAPGKMNSLNERSVSKKSVYEKLDTDHDNKWSESATTGSSMLDQLWLSERTKEISRSKSGGDQKIKSMGLDDVEKLVQTTGSSTTAISQISAGGNHSAGAEEDRTPNTKKESMMGMVKGKTRFLDGSHSDGFLLPTSSQILQLPKIANDSSTFPLQTLGSLSGTHAKPQTGKNTEVCSDDINATLKPSSSISKSLADASNKQFLETLTKELDTFVGTAGWTNSKTSSQIRIDWDKCNDVRKRRQQEKLRRVLIPESSHCVKPQIQTVQLAKDRSEGGRGDSSDCGIKSRRESAEDQVHHVATLKRRSEIQVEKKRKDRVRYGPFKAVPRITSTSCLQASPNVLYTKDLLTAMHSSDSSPHASESVYSTGMDDVSSLESWASAKTETSKKEPPPYAKVRMFSQTPPSHLPSSVVVLSPAEVKLLTAAEYLRSVDKSAPGEKDKSVTSDTRKEMSTTKQRKTYTFLPSYKTSSKPVTHLHPADHTYAVACDKAVSPRQASQFRTSSRPDIQFRTPGVPVIQPERKPSAFLSEASSPSVSDFLSISSVDENSPKTSRTSFKTTLPSDKEPMAIESYTSAITKEFDDIDFVRGADLSKISADLGSDYRSPLSSKYRSDVDAGSKCSKTPLSFEFASVNSPEDLSLRAISRLSNRSTENAPLAFINEKSDRIAEYISELGANSQSDLHTSYAPNWDTYDTTNVRSGSKSQKFSNQSFQRTSELEPVLAVSSPLNTDVASVDDVQNTSELISEGVDGAETSLWQQQAEDNNLVTKSVSGSARTDSDSEDALRVLSYLSSVHSCSWSTHLNDESISGKEAGATRISDSQRRPPEELTADDECPWSPSDHGDASQACTTVQTSKSNLPVTSQGMSEKLDTVAIVTLPSGMNGPRSPEKRPSPDLLLFSRASSPVEATSLTSEWNTFPIVQKAGATNMGRGSRISALEHLDKPGTAEQERPAVATDHRQHKDMDIGSSGGISSPSLPSFSDLAYSYTVSVFPKTSSISPASEACSPSPAAQDASGRSPDQQGDWQQDFGDAHITSLVTDQDSEHPKSFLLSQDSLTCSKRTDKSVSSGSLTGVREGFLPTSSEQCKTLNTSEQLTKLSTLSSTKCLVLQTTQISDHPEAEAMENTVTPQEKNSFHTKEESKCATKNKNKIEKGSKRNPAMSQEYAAQNSTHQPRDTIHSPIKWTEPGDQNEINLPQKINDSRSVSSQCSAPPVEVSHQCPSQTQADQHPSLAQDAESLAKPVLETKDNASQYSDHMVEGFSQANEKSFSQLSKSTGQDPRSLHHSAMCAPTTEPETSGLSGKLSQANKSQEKTSVSTSSTNQVLSAAAVTTLDGVSCDITGTTHSNVTGEHAALSQGTPFANNLKHETANFNCEEPPLNVNDSKGSGNNLLLSVYDLPHKQDPISENQTLNSVHFLKLKSLGKLQAESDLKDTTRSQCREIVLDQENRSIPNRTASALRGYGLNEASSTSQGGARTKDPTRLPVLSVNDSPAKPWKAIQPGPQSGGVVNSFDSPLSSLDQHFFEENTVCGTGNTLSPSTTEDKAADLDSSFDFSLRSMVTLHPENEEGSMGQSDTADSSPLTSGESAEQTRNLCGQLGESIGQRCDGLGKKPRKTHKFDKGNSNMYGSYTGEMEESGICGHFSKIQICDISMQTEQSRRNATDTVGSDNASAKESLAFRYARDVAGCFEQGDSGTGRDPNVLVDCDSCHHKNTRTCLRFGHERSAFEVVKSGKSFDSAESSKNLQDKPKCSFQDSANVDSDTQRLRHEESVHTYGFYTSVKRHASASCSADGSYPSGQDKTASLYGRLSGSHYTDSVESRCCSINSSPCPGCEVCNPCFSEPSSPSDVDRDSKATEFSFISPYRCQQSYGAYGSGSSCCVVSPLSDHPPLSITPDSLGYAQSWEDGRHGEGDTRSCSQSAFSKPRQHSSQAPSQRYCADSTRGPQHSMHHQSQFCDLDTEPSKGSHQDFCTDHIASGNNSRDHCDEEIPASITDYHSLRVSSPHSRRYLLQQTNKDSPSSTHYEDADNTSASSHNSDGIAHPCGQPKTFSRNHKYTPASSVSDVNFEILSESTHDRNVQIPHNPTMKSQDASNVYSSPLKTPLSCSSGRPTIYYSRVPHTTSHCQPHNDVGVGLGGQRSATNLSSQVCLTGRQDRATLSEHSRRTYRTHRRSKSYSKKDRL